jgi:DNA-binding Xre family transcriptional regulator
LISHDGGLRRSLSSGRALRGPGGLQPALRTFSRLVHTQKNKELAERIGITEQNVSLLRSGKVRGVRFDTLAKICQALDCQPVSPYSPSARLLDLSALHFGI